MRPLIFTRCTRSSLEYKIPHNDITIICTRKQNRFSRKTCFDHSFLPAEIMKVRQDISFLFFDETSRTKSQYSQKTLYLLYFGSCP